MLNTMLNNLIEKFEPMNFIENLDIMAAGMLGIFIVIGILIAFIFVLNAITNRKKGEKKRKLKRRLKKTK